MLKSKLNFRWVHKSKLGYPKNDGEWICSILVGIPLFVRHFLRGNRNLSYQAFFFELERDLGTGNIVDTTIDNGSIQEPLFFQNEEACILINISNFCQPVFFTPTSISFCPNLRSKNSRKQKVYVLRNDLSQFHVSFELFIGEFLSKLDTRMLDTRIVLEKKNTFVTDL